MASESIIVYIDPQQITAQKTNNYSLYLAKKVNGKFTVIWQSKGPIATVNTPSYQYQNNFDIAVPSYQVNYGNVTQTSGSVSFTSSGKPVSMDIGQTVSLDQYGQFGTPVNAGSPGTLTVRNNLAGNPNEILLDQSGNAIFVNKDSGMDIGTAELTPIDEYQIWFDNYQATGTIIAHNASNAKVVTFDGESTTQTIYYNRNGQWVNGGPPSLSAQLHKTMTGTAMGGGIGILTTILVHFNKTLTVVAATYLLSQFINKFGDNLRPKEIQIGSDRQTLRVTFEKPAEQIAAANSGAFSSTNYIRVVDAALTLAKDEGEGELADESWWINEEVGVQY